VVIPIKDLVEYCSGVFDRKKLRRRIVIALFPYISNRNERERIADVIVSKLEKGDYQVV